MSTKSAKMHPILKCAPGFLALAVLSTFTPSGTASADEVCGTCGMRVVVSGDFSHYYVKGAAISGVPRRQEQFFRHEIHGKKFTVSVPHLGPGKYTAVFGMAEIFFKEPHKRVFDITRGDQVVARNLDLFAAAGGRGKVVFLTNHVDFPGDKAAHGPLTYTFTGRVNDAKLSTFELTDDTGTAVVFVRAADLVDSARIDDPAAFQAPVVPGPQIWKDPSQPLPARVQDLIRRMSLAEKVQQLRNATPAIPRLGIPAYNYWSEALHGVASAGIATVFPQAIGMAATWNKPLIHQEGDVISTEARAKFNDYTSKHHGNSKGRYGLTFWSPNINLFRDPRWGRGQETYGEDPFLSGQIALGFIGGLQGDNPKYIKAMGCAKHYAVHSGPEPLRHRFNVNPSAVDLYDTYLPAFETAVRQGHVGGVMGAYSALYGVPDCASPLLLTDILRKQWGFDGYVVSDCGAIRNIFANHKYVATPEEAAAVAVKAGCDICCGSDYNALLGAVVKHLITESEINRALTYALETRFRLGLFDPPSMVPWSRITIAQNDTPEHQALALKVAEQSIVLLKNNGLLPLNRARIKRLAVIGPNANSVPVLVGNYHGTPSHPVTLLDGIKAVAGPKIQVTYEPGCPLALRRDGSNQPDSKMLNAALAAAKSADTVIFVGGISAQLEGEEMSSANHFVGFNGGDRTRIELPSVQADLLKAIQAVGKPVVLVNCSGSAVALPWEAAHLPAILQAWYPGEEGGRAVGEVLFGDVNPAGRLPITFYRATADLPPFEDYSMSNRTYRYFNGKPLFAFGHGLSYTRFRYRNARLNGDRFAAADTLKLTFTLKNTGKRDGDEVAQVYFRQLHPALQEPKLALCAFTRTHLAKGDSTTVTLEIPAKRFRCWDTAQAKYVVPTGSYQLLIAAASDDIRLNVPFTIK